MTIINDTTIVVFTFSELKSTLEEKNNYTYIYLGNNIKLTSGITISNTKKNIIIDGTYNNTTYTYEDMQSTSSADTISVRNATTQKVTIKNLTVVGHNYYGIIYVPEDNNLSTIIIEYNNVTYNGPQITFHPTGLSVYIDCNITIITSYSVANEVAECNRIEIGGNTTILHTSTGDSSFWFRGSVAPYFKILKNANAKITSQSRELFYGTNNLTFQVLENATLILTTSKGMGYATYSTSNVLIDVNASLKITQTEINGSYPTWYCNGPFIMNENSSLHIICNYKNITTANYCIYFTSSNASLTLNNPKELILYNAKASALYSSSTIPFILNYSRINMWSKATSYENAGSLNDLPTYSWYKDNALSNVTGTFSSTLTTIKSTNYTLEELAILPVITNFSFQGKPVLSIGKMILNIAGISDTDTIIQGYTEPTADIKIDYLLVNKVVTANQEGQFSLILDNALPIETKITFLANIQNSFIYQSKTVQIVYNGELILTNAPTEVSFSLLPFSTSPILCPKKEDISFTITDTRLHSTDWKLYATIDHNLLSKNGYSLTDSLVYIDTNKKIYILSSNPTLVYTGTSNNGSSKITTILWKQEEGIILQIANEPIQNEEQYTAKITWILEE